MSGNRLKQEWCCYEMMTRRKRVDRPAGNAFGFNLPQGLNEYSPSAKPGKKALQLSSQWRAPRYIVVQAEEQPDTREWTERWMGPPREKSY